MSLVSYYMPEKEDDSEMITTEEEEEETAAQEDEYEELIVDPRGKKTPNQIVEDKVRAMGGMHYNYRQRFKF